MDASSGLAEKKPSPLGSWAPSRKNLEFDKGDSILWYGMVWYGMVWYGMVWYGMVWYGMVWYGMVCYGMVWYGMAWYVAVVVVGALSTCLREKLPDTLSLGRAQGSSQPAQCWPGGCQRRPRGKRGAAFCPGGRGARVAEGRTTCPRDACSVHRRGGRVCTPVRDGSRMEDWREGPPVRGPVGSRLPLLLRPPRIRGGSVLPV